MILNDVLIHSFWFQQPYFWTVWTVRNFASAICYGDEM